MTESAKAAASIRRELKIEFPEIKFSVRSRNFAGGDAVDIEYTDAIPTAAIEGLVGKYQNGSFDGSNDLYTYDNVREDIPQAKYVHVNRHLSPEASTKLKNELAKVYGIKDVANEQEWRQKFGTWSDQAVWREASIREL